jgi:hypothetical protein
LAEKRRGFHKRSLNKGSYKNKRKVIKVERALKFELRRPESEVMEKITEDPEDAATGYNSSRLY